ncbi:MAG: hypothetical protein ACRAVC_15275 [Trichormus sp.]
MVKITISDLSPSDHRKFLNELTAWEMTNIYAGSQRRYGRRQAMENMPEAPTAESVTDTTEILNRWMSNLEVEIQDLRSQLGIR